MSLKIPRSFAIDASFECDSRHDRAELKFFIKKSERESARALLCIEKQQDRVVESERDWDQDDPRHPSWNVFDVGRLKSCHVWLSNDGVSAVVS